MAGLNKVQLIGHLGDDPDSKFIPNGDAVCEFRIAVSESWKDKAGVKQERTEWFTIKAWRGLAEVCGKYLSKGKQVYVEGKLSTRFWERDGIKHQRTEVIASDVQFLGSKGGGERSESRSSQGDPGAYVPPANGPDSDLPFATCELADADPIRRGREP